MCGTSDYESYPSLPNIKPLFCKSITKRKKTFDRNASLFLLSCCRFGFHIHVDFSFLFLLFHVVFILRSVSKYFSKYCQIIISIFIIYSTCFVLFRLDFSRSTSLVVVVYLPWFRPAE